MNSTTFGTTREQDPAGAGITASPRRLSLNPKTLGPELGAKRIIQKMTGPNKLHFEELTWQDQEILEDHILSESGATEELARNVLPAMLDRGCHPRMIINTLRTRIA